MNLKKYVKRLKWLNDVSIKNYKIIKIILFKKKLLALSRTRKLETNKYYGINSQLKISAVGVYVCTCIAI